MQYVSTGILLSRLLECLSVVSVFKNVGEGPTAKKYCPLSLLSVFSKVFEKLGNNKAC